jgi:hypothetical protein
MEYTLEWIGELSLKILGRFHEERVGKIVQGFKNTAYIKTVDDELICLTSYHTRAPMNLNFKGELDFRSLDYDDAEVIITNDGLHIKDTGFIMSYNSVYLGKKQFDIKNGVCLRALFAARAISLFDLSGSLLDPQSPFFKDLSYLIKAVSNFVCDHNFDKVQEYLPSLIGLGNGFTPSGDDFIVGFLFCLNQSLLCRDWPTMNIRIKYNTNWVSKKFIEYSQAGYVIEPIEKFVDSLFAQKDEVIISALADLMTIGHSSGIDASVGILFATALHGKKDFCESIHNTLSL